MASPEFPNNLATNTYILHDYQEIAYIVCTGAIPNTVDRAANIPDPNTKERILARLKNARQQFRQAAILVVLDTEKLELITFYKKADIVKDQQAILSKFGQICKQNACKIERKNACRVLDLVKPESARVWKLFSEAVLSSLVLQTPSGRKVWSINTNVHIVPEVDATLKNDSSYDQYKTKYYLCKADLQIVTGGHLLLAVRPASWPCLYPCIDMIDGESFAWKECTSATVFLLPTGQLGRYVGGWVGKPDAVDAQAQNYPIHDINDVRSRSRWVAKVLNWLHNRGDQSMPPQDELVWCTIEIPVLETLQDGEISRFLVTWKPILWPANLIFMFQGNNEQAPQIDDMLEDPLLAAQAWYNRDFMDARAAGLAKEQMQSKHEGVVPDGHLFDDDIPFGSPQQFTSVPAHAFHPVQTVYPTPPEAMNPQNTPGMSIDGAAQTPMFAQPMQSSIYQSSPLATMTESEIAPAHESAISNFLQHDEDDDLFDDGDDEDQKLAQPAFGDEPNWDFFDREPTTLEMKQGMNFEGLTTSPEVERTPEPVPAASLQSPESEVKPNEQPHTGTQEPGAVQASSPIRTTAAAATDIDPRTDEQQEDHGMSGTAASEDQASAMPPKVRDFAQSAVESSSATPEHSNPKRRRSSVYDIDLKQNSGHDHKYGPNGKYHFDLKRPSLASKQSVDSYHPSRRDSSSSSSSQLSQPEDDSGAEDNMGLQARSWTRYEPTNSNGVQVSSYEEDFDVTSCDADIEELLEVVSLATGLEPFTTPFPVLKHRDVESSFRGAHNRWSMIAQVLTEQLTQSSLFKDCESLQLPRMMVSPAFEVSVDSTESGTRITSASLGELSNIQPASNNTKATSRVLALETDRLRLKQADSEMIADLSIMKYWETLNLQPLSGSKNLQALCLHPKGNNLSKACDSFMRRMEETFTSCNMGTHRRLQLQGITDNGLVSWNPAAQSTALISTCQKIGNALGKTISGCTILYMILPDDQLFRCVEVCEAFVELFETIGQINSAPAGDIALQLVPSSFLVDPLKLVIPTQEQYVNLATEVYNRTPSLGASQPAVTAGAAMLERPTRRPLQFEINSKVNSPFLRSGHCYHVAYCSSIDRKWLVAAWSDTVGNVALTMSYCLVDEDDELCRPRLDILKHICETSVHLMTRHKRQSWLAIAKVGLYDHDELQEWLHLSQSLNDEHKFIMRIVILNVEMESRLTLQTIHGSVKQSTLAAQSVANTLNTPVSTPLGNMTSPDQNVPTISMSASAPTPPDLSADPASEADTYLSDPLNETWMVTFAFGLNQTHNFLEIRPALASGLLLKKTNRQDDIGGLTMLNVNLITVPRKGATALAFAEREQILQDVLMQYRGLHVLAVARRCVDDGEGCIPWHIATVYRGARILEQLM